MTTKKKSWLWLLALIALPTMLAFIGCSDDDDDIVTPPPNPNVTETIGAVGGSLVIKDKLDLTIPAGALGADVEFTAGPAETPPALPAGLVAVSDIFSIEPSGTDFGQDADLTLFYDEGALPQFVTEDMLEVYTHDGVEWDDLSGLIDEDTDSVVAAIGHLSLFVVTAPVPEQPDDVYLEFNIERHLHGDPGGAEFDGYDTLSAEFKSSAPLKIEAYLDAGNVSYGEWDLIRGMGSYYYSSDEPPIFMDLGTNYDLVVEGSLEVTPMTIAVATMASAPQITNVTDDMELPLEGFDVTWSGSDQGGSAVITLDAGDGGYMTWTTDNPGSFTFTEEMLGSISAGDGSIQLTWHFSTPIPADGYMSECRTKYETSHEISAVFTGGGEAPLQDRMVTSVAGLAIPDAPSGGGGGTRVFDIINMPITGEVDSVRVYLDITHEWMSDLICRLTSPDGTELRVLFIGEGGETDGRMMGWYPDDFTPKDDLNGFDGESAGGNWTLSCQDYSSGAAGVLNQWRLQVFYR